MLCGNCIRHLTVCLCSCNCCLQDQRITSSEEGVPVRTEGAGSNKQFEELLNNQRNTEQNNNIDSDGFRKPFCMNKENELKSQITRNVDEGNSAFSRFGREGSARQSLLGNHPAMDVWADAARRQESRLYNTQVRT